ncbi:MAG TPA: tRNA (N(6)-L-threonylcarbamoyladenosine(37)-C(2))-methylthiotransferase MtaB [Bacteroidota bacterium]
MPRVALHTSGCKLNFAETSTIGRQFMNRGYDVVSFDQPADVCVLNTCSVTDRADRECRQLIRRALRNSPNAYVVVTGCYAQLQPDEVSGIQGVDLVLGANEKFDLFGYAGNLEKELYPHVFVSEITSANNFGAAYSTEASNRTRAFLKVQDGCDYSCAFCTIPLARGGSRSQSIEECLRQANELVQAGYKEIVLTGVNTGDYGKHDGTNLYNLLRALMKIEGVQRLRISSIEPNLLSDDIIALAADSEVLCPHFHIPLQSGSDNILRKMRRRYSAGMYRKLLDKILLRIPHCGIGIDVIVGFPGETDEEFDRTQKFLDEIPASYLHVFTYSERLNTPASSFPHQVQRKDRFQRNAALRQLGLKKKQDFSARYIGMTMPVLFEGVVQEGERAGWTPNYIRVHVPAQSAEENTVVPVVLADGKEGECCGMLSDDQVTA